MESDQSGYEGIALINGERIESMFTPAAENSEVVLLTNKRVIHLDGDDGSRMASFASLEDIDAVEITVESKGTGGLIWAALAFIVAISLYAAIEHSLGRIVAPIAVAAMGVYLIVDHVTSRGRPMVIFTTGSYQLRCGLRTERARDGIHPFVNSLFQLKEQNGRGAHDRRFPPL